jgi:hypothetical protein
MRNPTMPDCSGLEFLPSQVPLIVTFAVRPEEIELALATNGDSLRQRLLLALVAELTTIEMEDSLRAT